jgi:hypothetical protein
MKYYCFADIAIIAVVTLLPSGVCRNVTGATTKKANEVFQTWKTPVVEASQRQVIAVFNRVLPRERAIGHGLLPAVVGGQIQPTTRTITDSSYMVLLGI